MYSYQEFQELVKEFNEWQEPWKFSQWLPTIMYYGTDWRIAKNSVTIHLYIWSMKVWQSKVIDYDKAVDYVQLITLLLSLH